MDAIAGMDATHRRVQGPGFELVGLDSPQGVHTALCVGADPGGREAGWALPDHARAFLERPGVAGLARLAAVDRDQRCLVYATGAVWSLPELWAMWRRQGRVAGLRAALELAWGASEVLAKAHVEGASLGVPCHGALDPWRLAVRPDGQVMVLGYGVTPVKGSASLPQAFRDECWRYAPPERVAEQPEGPSGDVFGLALVVLECMLGEPVYRGAGDVVREAAGDASVDRRLYALREHLPEEVRAVLGRATRRDADARFADAAAFSAAIRVQLASPHVGGASLRQLLAEPGLQPRARFLGLEELRRVAEPVLQEDVAAATDDQGPRWVSLGGRRAGRSRDQLAAPTAPPEQVGSPGRDVPEDDTDVWDAAALAPITEHVPLDTLRGEITGGERTLLRVRLPSGTEIVHATSADRPCGHVARDLADRVGLPTTDLLGRTRVAWALSSQGRTVAGSTPVQALPGDGVALEAIANRPIEVEIVVTVAGQRSTFSTRVGAAVTCRALVAHVRDKLDLGPGTGAVRVDGRDLGLDDLLVGTVTDGCHIEVAT